MTLMARTRVKAWALENPHLRGNLFSGSKPVLLFQYKYEAQDFADWQESVGSMPWKPVRVLISIAPSKGKRR